MVGYKEIILQKQSFSEIKWGELHWSAENCQQTVEQFQKNVCQHKIVTTVNISSSALHSHTLHYKIQKI